ncbi:hypothetical protein [Williamsia sp.]|uniref:hypothetical protein n=1 Tax=Williamsia sp. TaxID=1872085 RepID=UPI001A1B0C26|nr:hypothetical protein [Williamsia sp.]MBJ7291481.1 hypothetical protein [Williamsia sp.]
MRLLRNPVAGLFFLAPLIAEFFLGDFPVYLLPLILPLSLWYGAGAVMIREVTRRLGRGWPTILLLGLAFGVAEEGLLTMSLFNPNYADQRLLDPGHIAALGIGVPWTIFVLTLHVLWSVAAPIALIESAQPQRRATPWLGNRAMAGVGVLFVVGAAVTYASNHRLYGHFIASPTQLATSAVIVIALVAVGLTLPRRSSSTADRTVPSPWIVGAATMICAGAFQLTGHNDDVAISVVGMVVSLVALAAAISWWARSTGWTATHRFAVAAGLVLTYTWRAFFAGYGHGTSEMVTAVASYVLYAVAALSILLVIARRITTPAVVPFSPPSRACPVE